MTVRTLLGNVKPRLTRVLTVLTLFCGCVADEAKPPPTTKEFMDNSYKVKEKMTEQQVEDILGRCSWQSVKPNDETTVFKTWQLGQPGRGSRIVVIFKDGKVQEVRSSTHDRNYRPPWRK